VEDGGVQHHRPPAALLLRCGHHPGASQGIGTRADGGSFELMYVLV
jgi:hypothetical protein